MTSAPRGDKTAPPICQTSKRFAALFPLGLKIDLAGIAREEPSLLPALSRPTGTPATIRPRRRAAYTRCSGSGSPARRVGMSCPVCDHLDRARAGRDPDFVAALPGSSVFLADECVGRGARPHPQRGRRADEKVGFSTGWRRPPDSESGGPGHRFPAAAVFRMSARADRDPTGLLAALG